jgi:hypothetical protein
MEEKDKVRDYILSNIDNSGYDDKPLPHIENKLQFLHDTFMSEYGHNVPKMGMTRALESWLQGLPSSINIAFEYYDIHQLLKQWGLINATTTSTRLHELEQSWFMRLAMQIVHLFKTHKIS